ncbi:hypothetical protein EVAR_35433_1 [Eumeta japonica]|uniref:Uncharacterized protein n=1 Tax=Eumeta variegata TaxID=151549 RepID=A0A4C1XAS0_EUMVA|nr:hypothetical protein EVAR_35433_1 [Eumeta japonica]
MSMKRKVFDALFLVEIGGKKFRVDRTKIKRSCYSSGREKKTHFSQICSLLTSLGSPNSGEVITPRSINIDVMMGYIKASKVHEVMVCEDRDEKTDTVNIVNT